MKKLVSVVLLLFAFPMFTGGIFEIEGMMGPPSLFWAIVLSLSAQLAVLTAASIAPPKTGKVGFFRSVAFIFFFLQSVPIPIALFALLYKKFGHVELFDSSQLIWYLVESFSGLGLLLFSAKTWNLSLQRLRKSEASRGYQL
ncbi:MAG TPA: hypothetical protein VKQ28_16005 [Candidatus Acidoferrum sp.]|nr:hypothetical protein [Candidatus Acidoferrum sp.]